jgi:hypothetical protein
MCGLPYLPRQVGNGDSTLMTFGPGSCVAPVVSYAQAEDAEPDTLFAFTAKHQSKRKVQR